MFEYIFDYQQRLALEDNLNLKELTLLFYLAKKILFTEPQQQFRNFTYREIISDIPILRLERIQISRLINRLYSLNYIKLTKTFGSFSVGLTKKYFKILSPRHVNDNEVITYLNILNCSSMNKLAKKSNESCSSMNNSLNIYNSIITKISLNNILDDDIKTININNNSNNIIKDNLTNLLNNIKSFFKLFSNIKIDCDLDLSKINIPLITLKVKESRFLKQFQKLSQLIKLYDNIINDKYKDFNSFPNSAFRQRNFQENYLDSLFDNLDEVEF